MADELETTTTPEAPEAEVTTPEVVADAPASLQPANDNTRIGLRNAGRLSKLKASIIFTM